MQGGGGRKQMNDHANLSYPLGVGNRKHDAFNNRTASAARKTPSLS